MLPFSELPEAALIKTSLMCSPQLHCVSAVRYMLSWVPLLMVVNCFKTTMTNCPWMGTLADEFSLNNTSEEESIKTLENL